MPRISGKLFRGCPVTSTQRLADFVRPTVFGKFRMVSYNHGGNFAFAAVSGELPVDHLPVRVQSACLFGESLGVNSCDCAAQLHQAMRLAAEAPHFLVIHLPGHEGRGLGMFQKIKAVEEEAVAGVDMVEAFHRLGLPLDLRDYKVAADIIRDLNGDRPIRLYANNPKKVQGLEEHGLTISERVPLLVEPPNDECRRYLNSKREGMGHLLPQLG